MSDGFPYGDIIILALIAGFVLLRLRAVLGQKIGHDTPPFSEFQPAETDSPIVQVGEKLKNTIPAHDADEKVVAAIGDPKVRDGIMAIKAADKDFSLAAFLEGAKGAFEMVFDAFVKDDRDTLKLLLSPELFNTFASELDKRKTMENHPETTLLALVSQE